MKKKFYVGVLFFVVNPFFLVWGQSLNQSDAILDRFQSRFDELDSLIFSVPSLTEAAELERKPIVVAAVKDLYDPYLYSSKNVSDIAYLKSKWGFEVSGQTYYRLDKKMGFDEEDAVSRYSGKIQAELSWSFFQSSFFKRKGKMREIMLENQIAQNRFEHNLMSAHVEDNEKDVQQQHDELLAGILIHRITNLDLIYVAYRHLLGVENISSDEMLDILDEKTKAERMLASISGSYQASVNLSNPRSLVVKIDTIALMEDIKNQYFDFKDIKMRTALLEQKYKNTDYLQSAAIAPFIRYSHYTRTAQAHSTNVDIGVRFRLPVSGEVRKKKKALAVEKQLLSLETLQVETMVTAQVRKILAEIERLDYLSAGEIRRIRELKKYLEDRKTAYENLIGKYSMPARMKEYNVYLSCWESLIGFQYKRDCLLNDLQLLLGEVPVKTYYTKIEL